MPYLTFSSDAFLDARQNLSLSKFEENVSATHHICTDAFSEAPTKLVVIIVVSNR